MKTLITILALICITPAVIRIGYNHSHPPEITTTTSFNTFSRTMYVPLQCIIHAFGKPSVLIKKNNYIEIKEVLIGEMNHKFIAVLKGIKEGDDIILNPQLEYGKLTMHPQVPEDSIIVAKN